MTSDLFYNFNKKILDRSNLSLNHMYMKSEEEIIEENGVKKLHEIAYCRLSDGCTSLKMLECPILGFQIVFGIFDIYIDSKYNNLGGKSFKYKHDHLPQNNNIEIMQRSFYRIYKLIRNAIIHSINSIDVQNDKIIIDYTFCPKNGSPTHFFLEISNQKLLYLYTATIISMDEKILEDRGYKYKEGILSYYYNQIIGGLNIYDDIHFFGSLNNILDLCDYRTIVTNATYSTVGDKIIIENNKFVRQTIRDFTIEVDDQCYIIPQEHLVDNAILISDIEQWKSSKLFVQGL